VSDVFDMNGVADSRNLARIGILMVSDRASRGEYRNQSGEAIGGSTVLPCSNRRPFH